MTDYTNPTKDSFRAFRDCDREGPIHMLNLVKLRKVADYEDGRIATGAEAYQAYGQQSGQIFHALSYCQIWCLRISSHAAT